jgi:hypothetical protein
MVDCDRYGSFVAECSRGYSTTAVAQRTAHLQGRSELGPVARVFLFCRGRWAYLDVTGSKRNVHSARAGIRNRVGATTGNPEDCLRFISGGFLMYAVYP